MCVVSVAHQPLGVDAERIDRETDNIPLPERYFSASEVRGLRALPLCEQAQSFFAYWTLKESYVKARASGCYCPSISFRSSLKKRSLSNSTHVRTTSLLYGALRFSMRRLTT